MNNKVNNPEVAVSKTIELNDRDYLQTILDTEKNMSNNLSIAINEASNDVLFDKLYDIFDKAQENNKNEENTKLTDKYNELETKK